MKTYLDFKKSIDYTKLKEMAKHIKDGEIVIFPTETVYGIGTNGLNCNSLKKLYDIKKRPLNKPISLLVNSIDMINSLTKDVTPLEYALIKEFFPGPLTMVLKKKECVPDILTAGLDTVGIRMPANEIALKLIEYSNVPIATSSANISGEITKNDTKIIFKDFENTVNYFIDNGSAKIGTASTLVQVIDNVPHILRQGSISKEKIFSFCDKFISKT